MSRSWWLLAWLAVSAAVAVPCPGRAAAFGSTVTTLSQSGQFVVTGPRAKSTRPLTLRPNGDSNPDRELFPQTLAVSCERVKVEILRALELSDDWRTGGGNAGKILVGIDPTVRTNLPIAVQASRFERGWQFRVALPTRLTEERLVRALAQAIVMELASRAGSERPGEPPLWFVEGLTQIILQRAPDGVILQPQTRATLDVDLRESLDQVRDRLTRSTPFAFHELSQPDLAGMTERDWARFSASAHLCVRELLRSPEGTARACRWLGSLQQFWNWQTGFIEAFQPGFRSLLDAEKWWALTVANFTGRSALSAWPAPFALRKLDDALQPIGIVPGAGGQAARLPIESIVATWDFARQTPVLRQLLTQLQAIRIHAPAEVAPLAIRYLDVLEDYLNARGRAQTSPVLRGQSTGSVKLATREAVGRLRLLEAERLRLTQELANPPTPPASASASTAGK